MSEVAPPLSVQVGGVLSYLYSPMLLPNAVFTVTVTQFVNTGGAISKHEKDNETLLFCGPGGRVHSFQSSKVWDTIN